MTKVRKMRTRTRTKVGECFSGIAVGSKREKRKIDVCMSLVMRVALLSQQVAAGVMTTAIAY